MRHVARVFLLVSLAIQPAMAVTPKAYLRGPSKVQADQPIFLKFNDSVSDIPITIEQVNGPEKVPMGYWFDTNQKPIYSVGMASVPGSYQFALVAEGTPEGGTKPVRSYAFWTVQVTPLDTDEEVDPVDPDEGFGYPPKVPDRFLKLTIGRASAEYRLAPDRPEGKFSFTPKALKLFTIQTLGNGAWTMTLSGPDDPDKVVATDDVHDGEGANARIMKILKPGGTYYIRVRPLKPYQGKSFRVKVTSTDLVPFPPTPTPPPNPVPPKPTPTPPPVPQGELKVLFLYESEQPLTRQQDLVWHSWQVDEALTKNTAPGSDGEPGFRKFDDDTDISLDGPEWSEMMAAVKAELSKPNAPKLPVVGVFRGGKGTVYPLPTTIEGMLSIIQK